jgi:lysozyme
MDALAFLSCFGMDAGITGIELADSYRGVSGCHDLLHAQARAVILERVMQRLKEDEGAVKLGGRHLVYKDSLGLETVGYGRLLSRGLSENEAQYLLESDAKESERLAIKFPWFPKLDENRQAIVVCMIFNLGLDRFSGFHNMISALDKGDFVTAANAALDSKWATQVKSRANRYANILRSGIWE